MARSSLSPRRILLLAGGIYILVPPLRGSVLLAAAVVLVVSEVRARRELVGVPVRLIVDGVAVVVPASGGTVPFGDDTVQVRRESDRILVDGAAVAPGEFLHRGGAQLEVVR